MLYRIGGLLALVALGASAVACGPAGAAIQQPLVPAGSALVGVATPVAATGTQPRPFTVPGVAACVASDLDVRVQVADPSYVGAGPKDVSSWALNVRDVGTRPCFVGPTPNVSFSTASGVQAIPKGRPWNGDIVYLTPSAHPQPPYFGSAIGEIDVQSCHLSTIDHVKVDFGATQGSAVVRPGPAGGWGVTCPVAGETYFTELYGLPNSGSIGGYAPLTQTMLSAPAAARPGERLHFRVTLENTPVAGFGGTRTSPTITFKPCPVFYEEIEGVVGTFHSMPLNCADAKPLFKNASETFDMYIDIPAAARPGPATLVWSIDGSPAMYQKGTSYLAITDSR